MPRDNHQEYSTNSTGTKSNIKRSTNALTI